MIDEKKFLELYQRQKESGLTIRDFCSNEIIAPSTFYYWQKKLKQAKRLPGFIPVIINHEKPTRYHHPAPDKLFPPRGTAGNDHLLEIEYPNGTTVRVNRELDPAILRSLVHLYD
jgi:hypothetical protein